MDTTPGEPDPDPARLPVVVAGAGPAGLAAALVLVSRGLPVRLLEASPLVGGKVWSRRVADSDGAAGYSVEHGVHGWWPNYVNFDRLLEQAGVDLRQAFVAARGSALVDGDGRVHRVRFPFRLPSPLFVVEHALRGGILTLRDAIALLPAFVHLLAFRHAEDYLRYDSLSLDELLRRLGVPDRARAMLFRPFSLNFDYAPPERVSAASILSALQLYLLHSRSAIVPRWSRGLPQARVFAPLVQAIEDRGGHVECSTTLESVEIEDGRVRAAWLVAAGEGDAGTVVDELPESELPQDGFVLRAGGRLWVGRSGGRTVAFANRCTHQGGALGWSGGRFVCQRHGAEFEANGSVRIARGQMEALTPLAIRESGGRVQVLGAPAPRRTRCSHVIVAAHLPGARQILQRSPGVPLQLTERMGRLGTTPVVVIRLWFDAEAPIPADLEAAFAPHSAVIDNFFHLNQIDPSYDAEGQVVEVHACGAEGSDEEILALVLGDLSSFCPGLSRERLVRHELLPHPDVFTLYAPGAAPIRPGTDSGVAGLHLAGDWTRSQRPVWMMERAVVAGIEAANRVLRSHGLPPQPILEPAPEGLWLTAARWLARGLRWLLWRHIPDPPGNTRGRRSQRPDAAA